ncbi:hypothetical protein AB1Y20_018255 [Prymnesium parvum]|uniref:Uncharacterized protein n=1 Tax=Prymnesium parvum TaxID=97485 RepID=A0AB34JNQ4_PRYPA|mmetsp:Transcript_19247/g.28844  ORF Transcript_19247/g.28844 Transcript_19247/m.28844 type:complete len:185 (+) Transcript_19247:19-573(+)
MDALGEGGPSAALVVRENKKMVLRLSLRARAIFCLTNVPYMLFALQWSSAAVNSSSSDVCRAPALHRACLLGVSAISASYHIVQCFGQQLFPLWLQRRQAQLLILDVVTANAYALLLARCFGVGYVLPRAVSLASLMIIASVCKRRGFYMAYAVFHGVWHILSAVAIKMLILQGTSSSAGYQPS